MRLDGWNRATCDPSLLTIFSWWKQIIQLKEFDGFLSNLTRSYSSWYIQKWWVTGQSSQAWVYLDRSQSLSESEFLVLPWVFRSMDLFGLVSGEESQDDRGSTARVSTLCETPAVATLLDAFHAKLLVWLLSVPCTWWEASSSSWSKNRTLFFVILLSDDDGRVLRALLFPFGDSWLDEKSRVATWKKD